ncbi:MAG: multiple sugar transport system substrate-binding protein [Frankiaceae bacterium]|nr:multiple sugar transport system substrate-binding protein [Frankiaceae bacterium]
MTSRWNRSRGKTAIAVCAAGALALSGCSGGSSSSATAGASQSSATDSTGATSSSSASDTSTPLPKVKLQVMIGSSGAAETDAVKAATAAWSAKTGSTVEVIAAADLGQQLGQGFAGGTPPDVFYTDASRIGDFAKAGDLFAYGDQINAGDFLPNLVQAFTSGGKLQCAPKDYSTLALIINQDLWTKAGLTDADIPTDWAGLETVAKKLTSGSVTGLVIGNDINRSGAFMKQAGGWVVSADGTKVTADTPENLAGLQEVQKMMKAGTLKFNTDTSPAAGWGGEAFGKGIGAMTIEGNWIRGALTKDYPKINAKVVELPAGPKGKGTLLFSNCWGIAAKSPNQAQAVDLVKFLTSLDQQLAFTKAFGVMPSTTAGAAKFATLYPKDAAFAKGGAYGQGPVNLAGFDPVMAAFNSKLATLGKGGDPKAMLVQLQKDGDAALAGG